MKKIVNHCLSCHVQNSDLAKFLGNLFMVCELLGLYFNTEQCKAAV
jgi:hypothetical protein